MGDLSPHFDSGEFADKETQHYLPPPSELIVLLEAIRAETGDPLIVISGHRCCAHQLRIGDAPQSRHIYGDAADLAPGRVRLERAWELGAVGVGVDSDGWAVHVDVRPGPRVTWSY